MADVARGRVVGRVHRLGQLRSTRASALAPACSARSACRSRAVPAGLILTHPETLPAAVGSVPASCRSRARATAPRAAAVVDWLLEARPQARHLLITCNREGALATSLRATARGAHDRPRREDERPQPGDDQQLHEPGPGRPGARGTPAGRRGARARGPLARAAARGCCGTRRDALAARGAQRRSAPPSTSAAAAGSAPRARRRSRCSR